MIVLYPTDTVYGLGVDAIDPEAIKELQALKGREPGKPISIAVADMAMAEQYAVVTPLAERLAEKFLPGPLTLILSMLQNPPRGRICPMLAEAISAGTGTVGIRIINRPEIPELIQGFGGHPITATSANKSGMPTMPSVQQIRDQFRERADMILRTIDVGALPVSKPSTVVDARGDTPVVIREGAIPGSALL